MDWLYPIGRILFSMIFIMSAYGHLAKLGPTSQYTASKGVPAPKAATFLAGLMILAGGLSVILGVWMEIGAGLLFIFLIPTAFIMHNFWAVQDPGQRQLEQVMFLKDLGLAGGALVLYWLVQTHGYGPFTLGEPM